MPQLAVLIPVYNDQNGLDRTLASMRDDGTEPDIVVVVDDGSNPPIDHRPGIYLLRLSGNVGVALALNAGILHVHRHCPCDYIARLDAGDLTLPGRFAAQMAFLDAHPNHAVVGSWTEFVDPDGQTLFFHRPPTEHHELVRYMKWRNGIEHSTAMLRMSCLEAGMYHKRYCGAEDYELWLNWEGQGYNLANLPQVFVRKEVTPTQVTARPFRAATRLRVQLHHLDTLSLSSWLGIARTPLALMVPRDAVLAAKNRGWKS